MTLCEEAGLGTGGEAVAGWCGLGTGGEVVAGWCGLGTGGEAVAGWCGLGTGGEAVAGWCGVTALCFLHQASKSFCRFSLATSRRC